MNNSGRKRLVILTASSLVIGGLGFVGAQNIQTGGAEAQTQSEPQGERPDGFGPGFGFRGLPFGPHLALGTTVEVTLYDGDPEAGGSSLETLTFTYGEDSEAAFMQRFAEARENAQVMVVNVGEQTQTLDLAGLGSDLGPTDHHGALPLRGLEAGSSVEATFYDGDPEANGQVLQTLTFTYGQDSEAGFAADFAEAAEEAAFVTLTTSPQSYTVDLSAVPLGRDGNFMDRGDFRRDGFGPGGFGRGRSR